MMMPLCEGKTVLQGMKWVCVCGWEQIWRESASAGTLWVKRLATVTLSWPSAWMG
jgi:hypothetical protein